MKITKLRPFDLEAAKAGAPVVTRDGHPARILCTDCRDENGYTVIAAIMHRGEESVERYSVYGEWYRGKENDLDLLMASTKRKGWVNIYRGMNGFESGSVYGTEEEARAHVRVGPSLPRYIATVPVEWEE